jgi:hypothetical protein
MYSCHLHRREGTVRGQKQLLDCLQLLLLLLFDHHLKGQHNKRLKHNQQPGPVNQVAVYNLDAVKQAQA